MVDQQEKNDIKFLKEMMPRSKENVDLSESRIKAVADKTRRSIMAILYVRGPLFNTEIGRRMKLEPNALAYHLNLLLDAGYVQKELVSERVERNYSRYSISEEGVRFLDFIGAKPKLDEYRKQEGRAILEAIPSEITYDRRQNLRILLSSASSDDLLTKQLVGALKEIGASVLVLQASKLHDIGALENARMVRESDLVAGVLTEDGKHPDFVITTAGNAIASGKPLTLLVEAKYKSDKSHSLIIDYLAKHADQEIQLLEYNNKENPQVIVNEVVRRTAKLRR